MNKTQAWVWVLAIDLQVTISVIDCNERLPRLKNENFSFLALKIQTLNHFKSFLKFVAIFSQHEKDSI